jgi:hypothetical protein
MLAMESEQRMPDEQQWWRCVEKNRNNSRRRIKKESPKVSLSSTISSNFDDDDDGDKTTNTTTTTTTSPNTPPGNRYPSPVVYNKTQMVRTLNGKLHRQRASPHMLRSDILRPVHPLNIGEKQLSATGTTPGHSNNKLNYIIQSRIVEKVALHQHRLATLLRGYAGTHGEVTPKMLQASLNIVGVPLSNVDVKRFLTAIDPNESNRKTADTLIRALDRSSLSIVDDPDTRRRGIDAIPQNGHKGSHEMLTTSSTRRPAGVSVSEYERIRSGSQHNQNHVNDFSRIDTKKEAPASLQQSTNSPTEDSIVAKFRDHHQYSADFPSTNRKKKAIARNNIRANDSTLVGLELGHVLLSDSANDEEIKKNVGMWSSKLTKDDIEKRVHEKVKLHTGKKEPDWKHDTHYNESGRRVKNNLMWSSNRNDYDKQKEPIQLRSGKKTYVKIQKNLKRVCGSGLYNNDETDHVNILHHSYEPKTTAPTTNQKGGKKNIDERSPAGLHTFRIHKRAMKKILHSPIMKNQSEQVKNIIKHQVIPHKTPHKPSLHVSVPSSRRQPVTSPTRILHLSTPPPPPSTVHGT